MDTPMGEGTYLSIPARRPAPKFSTKHGCSAFFCAPERLKSGDGTEQAATSGGDVDVKRESLHRILRWNSN